MKNKGIKIALWIAHLFGIYVLYVYLYDILFSMGINIYISKFHYQIGNYMILRGPLFLLLGFIFFKDTSKINKIIGIFYLLVGIFWFGTLINALSQK